MEKDQRRARSPAASPQDSFGEEICPKRYVNMLILQVLACLM